MNLISGSISARLPPAFARADRYIFLPRVPVEQRLKGGLQSHKQGDSFPPRQRFESLAQIQGQKQRLARAPDVSTAGRGRSKGSDRTGRLPLNCCFQ